MRAALCAPLLLSALLVAASAGALGEDGAPLDTSDYTIDLHQGPVLGGSRIVGLAGAYTPIAEGVAGYLYNPAAVAHRQPWSVEFFDWELDGGVTLPASITNFDFDNNGSETFANSAAFFVTGGLGFQLGAGGIGGSVDWQLYQVEAGDDTLNVSIVRGLLLGGYGFLDGELIAGLGLSGTNVDIGKAIVLGESAGGPVASVTGPAGHVGLLWAPNYLPLRLGASARLSIPRQDSLPACAAPCEEVDGNYVIRDDEGDFYLPRSITQPHEIWAGFAVQFFRQLNFGWTDPRDEPSLARWVEARTDDEERIDEAEAIDRRRRLAPYKTMRREKLLFTAAVRVTWSTEDAIGLDAFLARRVERSGEHITFGPHAGVESEVWPGYLVLRAGSYLEPTRFRGGSDRWHGTGGFDVRIPVEWSVFGLLDEDTTFRLSGAVDGTVRYFGWGLGAGIWR